MASSLRGRQSARFATMRKRRSRPLGGPASALREQKAYRFVLPVPPVPDMPELPLEVVPPPTDEPDDEPTLAAFHSGMFFSSSVVFDSLKPSLVLSQLNWSTGIATLWPPTPSTPPAFTTRRSIDFDCGFISTVSMLPIFLSSEP